jgi:hypothetical protein
VVDQYEGFQNQKDLKFFWSKEPILFGKIDFLFQNLLRPFRKIKFVFRK